ncbi:MAG: endonuclease domain-containing protein [Candidatus Uhrbacteria bacterium]|nr:endonuclease domain-containing protein [Candidatus Uhrbacteria bacterium]
MVEKARKNRRCPTEAEKKMWYQVLSRKQFLPYKFLRQKPLDRFIVDFYCSELLLVIEIDGDSHASQIEYDQTRTDRLGEFDIRVIRYENQDVLQRLESMAEDLMEQVCMRKKELAGKPLDRKPPHSPLSGGCQKLPP